VKVKRWGIDRDWKRERAYREVGPYQGNDYRLVVPWPTALGLFSTHQQYDAIDADTVEME
jgi:hypothetical protein